MARARLVVIVTLLAALLPLAALAGEEATPDPGYGGVPLCQTPEDTTDCVPDPGPRPEGGQLVYTVIDGMSSCPDGSVAITVVTDRIVRFYVGADSQWHPITEEVDRVMSTRPMTAEELEECGPVIVVDPIDEEIPGDAAEPTPEAVATEDLTEDVPAQTTGTVQVSSLPSTGSGTPDNSPWGLIGGASVVFALAGIAMRTRKA